MGFLIGLLTVVMVFNCVILVLLVLIQLPKKEAGAGLAFGGGATDALFGAGSGTVLTKVTRYAATAFFVLAIVLSVMQSAYHNRNATQFSRQLGKPASLPPGPLAAPPAPAPATPSTPAALAVPPTAATNVQLLSAPAAESTNIPAAPPK